MYLREWLPKEVAILTEGIDVDWISLQYKGGTLPGITEYKWATQTQDYDDTAALVASLDRVICIQTGVAHLAGGLGVPVTVFVPEGYVNWRYARDPWYASMDIVRQSGTWAQTLSAFVEETLECQAQQTVLNLAS